MVSFGFTVQKYGIFTRDNNIVSSHIKWSLLLLLPYKSHLSQQKSAMVWYFVGVYIINRTLQGHLRNETSLLILENVCHTRSHHAVSLHSGHLEVMGTRKNAACKRDTYVSLERPQFQALAMQATMQPYNVLYVSWAEMIKTHNVKLTYQIGISIETRKDKANKSCIHNLIHCLSAQILTQQRKHTGQMKVISFVYSLKNPHFMTFLTNPRNKAKIPVC